MPVEQAPDTALGRPQPVHLIQVLRDLSQGDVGLFVDQLQDLLGMALEPVRAVIPALRARPDIPGPAPLLDHR